MHHVGSRNEAYFFHLETWDRGQWLEKETSRKELAEDKTWHVAASFPAKFATGYFFVFELLKMECCVCLTEFDAETYETHQSSHFHKMGDSHKICLLCQKTIAASNWARHLKSNAHCKGPDSIPTLLLLLIIELPNKALSFRCFLTQPLFRRLFQPLVQLLFFWLFLLIVHLP